MALTQRRITSAAEMRALAHPVRLRLLDLLGTEGSFTASAAARRLGETPANVSWHLRRLAAHGFVRQGDGPGRTKPWRYVAQSLTFGDDAEDPSLATALGDVFYDREFQVMQASMRNQPNEEQRWRDATSVVQSRLWLTDIEAQELGARIESLFLDEGLLERNQDPLRRPPGSRLMAIMGWVVPLGGAPGVDPGDAGTGAGDATQSARR